MIAITTSSSISVNPRRAFPDSRGWSGEDGDRAMRRGQAVPGRRGTRPAARETVISWCISVEIPWYGRIFDFFEPIVKPRPLPDRRIAKSRFGSDVFVGGAPSPDPIRSGPGSGETSPLLHEECRTSQSSCIPRHVRGDGDLRGYAGPQPRRRPGSPFTPQSTPQWIRVGVTGRARARPRPASRDTRRRCRPGPRSGGTGRPSRGRSAAGRRGRRSRKTSWIRSRPPGRQRRGAAADQRPALGDVPVVEDVREQDRVGPVGHGVGEHVAGAEFEAVGDAVRLGHLAGDLRAPRAGPRRSRGGRDAAGARRCCRCPVPPPTSSSSRASSSGKLRAPAPGRRSWPGRRGRASGDRADASRSIADSIPSRKMNAAPCLVGLGPGGPVGPEPLDHLDDARDSRRRGRCSR